MEAIPLCLLLNKQHLFCLPQLKFNSFGYPYNVRVTNFCVRMNKCGLLLI